MLGWHKLYNEQCITLAGYRCQDNIPGISMAHYKLTDLFIGNTNRDFKNCEGRK